MLHLLIDNCSLLQLSSINGYNEYLIQLEDHIRNGELTLITHALILEEWGRHKRKDKERKERHLLFLSKQMEQIQNNATNLLPTHAVVNTNHLALQVEIIDNLLAKAKVLTTPEGIKNEVAERIRNKLAPFHNKINSLNDWEIIGSACTYCEIYSIRELYFLSNNHTDFADKTDINRKIHPSLQDRFHKVTINYFKNYSDLFKELSTSQFPYQYIQFKFAPNGRFTFKSSIKKTDIESIYYLYNDLYSELTFIPTHILRKYYPFAKSEDSEAYYDLFTLSNVRENLIPFFESIEIGENNEFIFKNKSLFEGIEDYEKKVKNVFRHLTHNLVYKIDSKKSAKSVSTYFVDSGLCECYRCTYNRFEFHKTLEGIKRNEIELKERLKLAYINYKIGNFQTSCNLLSEIADDALKEKKYIIYFIAKYNLAHLAAFLKNLFYNKEINYQLIEELKNIDPLEEAVKLKSHTDYNLISFIAQEDFFTNAFQNIRKEVSEILDHYYSQLKGGFSYNNHVWSLVEEFAKLDTFLNSNYIIYDKYSNFERLFELVIEGLFASHAINEAQGDRLKSLDDYWIKNIILYGKKDAILKYFKRFNLKYLKYKSNSIHGGSFIELSKNFLSHEEQIRIKLEESPNVNNGYFIDSYNVIFENILTIASLIQLDKITLTRFSSILLAFLENEKSINRRSFESLKLFFSRFGRKLSKELLYKFITHFSNNPKDDEGDILNVVIGSFNNGELKRLSKRYLKRLLIKFIGKFDHSESNHSPDIVFNIYKKVNPDYQELISNYIKEKLAVNFDFELFYLASLYDVISLDKEKLYSLLKEIKVEKRRTSFSSMFSGREDYRIYYLDQLFNLYFKYNIRTDTIEFKKVKELHPYYAWLSDMDRFNYKNFNPSWVLNYQTIYYLKVMAKSKHLKEALLNYLKNNPHTGIERSFISMAYHAD